MIRPAPSHRFFPLCLAALLWPLVAGGCATLFPESHQQDFENLERIIKIYNNEFESKSDRAGTMWVRDDLKADYLTQIKEIYEKITFLNSQILSITFKNKGQSVSQRGSNPSADFDEAIVATRYEFVRSPSVSLQDKIIKQHWVKEGDIWKLIPDLGVFLE